MAHPPQPLLHDSTVVLRAPSQAWSRRDGGMSGSLFNGMIFSDVRLVADLAITVGGSAGEHIATSSESVDSAVFVSLLRHLDAPGADPGVRLEHTRTAGVNGFDETILIRSRLRTPIDTVVTVRLDTDATFIDRLKDGLGADEPRPTVTIGTGVIGTRYPTAAWGDGDVRAQLSAPGASIDADGSAITLDWPVTVPPGGSVAVKWTLAATDELAVVRGSEHPVPWATPTVTAGDERLTRWLSVALEDLDALRLTTTAHPDQQFLAAGAPWFFTLFGRDSLWSARFMLPLGTGLAADTLRVLAGMQGEADVADSAEEPGKIMHELRRGALEIPQEGIHLPPLYFGTVDATALWICLLHDAWRWGMPEAEVRALLPNLERALAWMRDYGDSDGDGLLEYVDKTGHGLANQGWKDSGDSVQWRDGSLASGPIALVEVQAYAFEAAMHGADLLDAFGGFGSPWREWAGRLRERFHASYWLEDADGPYLAIALDSAKRPVDSVTSNLGHVLGTGILDSAQAAVVGRRLVAPALNSGYGLRTMSADSAGYWPLSYHGGSVWTHDTAIAIAGLAREGLRDAADELVRGLLAAASGFDYRMPELHSGDGADEFAAPIPYPAACRPQAWSAASAVSVLASVLGLQPDAEAGELGIDPSAVVGALAVSGLVFGGASGSVTVDGHGDVTGADGFPVVVG